MCKSTKIQVGCTVKDKKGKKYRIEEIISIDGHEDNVIMYSLEEYKKLSGPLSVAEKELDIIRDPEGYDINGFDFDGYDREGYDFKGFDRKGFNREGLDRRGFNQNGFDNEGYDRSGFNKEGIDRNGKHRSDIKVPDYEPSCYAGKATGRPGASKKRRRK